MGKIRFCPGKAVWVCIAVLAAGTQAFAAGEEESAKLPRLIQATTLEEDYKAAASLGLTGTPLLKEGDAWQAFDSILSSCVRISTKGHFGSGSIFRMNENEIIIVTNRHVLAYWDEDSYVTFFNGAAASASLIGTSKERDVGFVQVPVDGFSYEELLSFHSVRIQGEAGGISDDLKTDRQDMGPEEGTGFFMVDMASDLYHPKMMEGEVISPYILLDGFQKEMLYGKGNAVPGMSGSGVFDHYGNYLGMVTGGNMLGEIAAVPGRDILAEYDRLGN
ncbi:MAG: serine protease [Lachnospiraceae bacterium]|nr:serine protease [Lachnospiraceae bacterium]